MESLLALPPITTNHLINANKNVDELTQNNLLKNSTEQRKNLSPVLSL